MSESERPYIKGRTLLYVTAGIMSAYSIFRFVCAFIFKPEYNTIPGLVVQLVFFNLAFLLAVKAGKNDRHYKVCMFTGIGAVIVGIFATIRWILMSVLYASELGNTVAMWVVAVFSIGIPVLYIGAAILAGSKLGRELRS